MVTAAALHHIRSFYLAYFAAMGLFLPFFPLYLTGRGLDVAMVGVVVGILSLSRVLAPPLIGQRLDRGEGAAPSGFIVTGSCVAALIAALFAPTDSIWLLALLVFLFGSLWSSMLPLADGLSVAVSESAAASYGRLRVWGSIGFVVASLVGGVLLGGERLMQFPFWIAGLMLAMALAARGFPAAIPDPHAASSAPLFAGPYLLLLATSLFMQASHGAYYGFYSLYLAEAGYSNWQISAFWILGVAAEIVLMWGWSRPMQQALPARLLSLCLLLAALRWLGIGLTDHWLLLALLQLLHAATFAAFHLSAVTLVRRYAPPGRRAVAQGWYAALGFGLGNTLGIVLCGVIAKSYGFPAAFFACAVMALIGIASARRLPPGRAD